MEKPVFIVMFKSLDPTIKSPASIFKSPDPPIGSRVQGRGSRVMGLGSCHWGSWLGRRAPEGLQSAAVTLVTFLACEI